MFPSTALWDAVSQPFKRAQSGLFHGKMKQYGNNVPFSKHKTRRTWLPNIQKKRIPSEIMGEKIKVKLTTRALKTIKKKGGLDNYLNTTSAELLGETGMRLRMQMRAKYIKNKGKTGEEFKLEPSYNLFGDFEMRYRSISNMLFMTRRLRTEVAQSLGKEGLASAEETIAHMDHMRRARKTAIRVV